MPVQTISLECRIAGRVVQRVLEISSSAGFDQINAEATIWVPERPSWTDEGQEATIYARNSATAGGQIFGGELVSFDWSFAPGRIGLVCGDLLARTRDPWGGDEYEYAEQDDAAIIRNLLEKKSIPSSAAHIESSGWTLGVIMPIILKEGDTPYNIISEIDDLAGFKTFSLTSGVIWRQRVSGAPGPSAALSFSRGVEILSDARRQRSKNGIVNRAIVTGVDYEGLTVGGPGIGEASSPNPYISDPSGFITETVQSNLIEDDAKALEIARRIVDDKNRRPEGLTISVPFDPRVQPGMTIQVDHDELETGSARAFVQNVAHAIGSGGAKTTIRTTGGQLGGYVYQPPVPNFSVKTYLEAEDTGSGISALVVVVADGSQSYDPDGTIASYAWTITPDAGSASPSSGAVSVFRTVVSGAVTSIDVGLTVTDNDGLTGVMSLTVPIDTSALPVEDIYVAYGNVACSSDGEQTWQEATPASGSATCLCAIAPSWGQAFGTTTGHVYATFDKLTTGLIDFGTPHGAVACTALWAHEVQDTRLWAAFSDGAVYLGTVDTAARSASWVSAGNVGAGPVNEIRESYGQIGELRATAGAGYYYSTNSGASWTLVHTFADTAWRMAAGFDTNLAGGLNDAAPIFDEDGTPPSVPGGVTHIRGISFGYVQQELYAADNAANLYIGPAPAFDLAAHVDDTAAQVNHMIRSGNLDRVVYMAVGDGTGANGFQKWIPDTKSPFFIKRTGTAAGKMIGYGPLHAPPVVGSFLMVGGNIAGGTGVYRTTDGGAHWTSAAGDLIVASWSGIVASPLNAQHWIAWNATSAYRTTNGGVNWTQITGIAAGLAGGAGPGALSIRNVEFSPNDVNKWAIVGMQGDAFAENGFVNRGSGNAVTGQSDWVSYGNLVPGFAGVQGIPLALSYGADDDLIVSLGIILGGLGEYLMDGRWIRYLAGSVAGDGDLIGNIGANFFTIDRGYAPQMIAGAAYDLSGSRGDVWSVNNYASGTPSQFGDVSDGTVTTNLAATLAAMYVGSSSGVYQLAYAPGSPTQVPLTAGKNVVFVRADRQNRRAVAVLWAQGGAAYGGFYFDGATWTTFQPAGNFATGSGGGSYAPWVEVIT